MTQLVPYSFIESQQDQDVAEYGYWLSRQDVTFMLGVASLSQLPQADYPEICFCGRSNVGKSSLVNAVLGRKGVARTSNVPGRTQQLNFFNLADRLILVDVPGYGYAKAPKAVVQQWTDLLTSYLKGRVSLKRVFVLIDSRHGIKKSDEEMMDMLDHAAVSYQIVLTKCDKLKYPDLTQRTRQVCEKLKKNVAALPKPIVTSSVKDIGLSLLRCQIAHVCGGKRKVAYE